MKSLSHAVLLFLFWMLLSGHFTPLLLGLGAASVLLTVAIARRMNVIDHESYPIHLSYRFPGYYLYLLVEIIKANLDVVRRILHPGKADIDPQLVELPQTQDNDLGAVIYANSITLTPGTVTLRLEQDKLIVHALSKEAAAGLAAGGMSREISKLVFGR